MNVHMRDSLTRIFSVLDCHIVLGVINRLQLFGYLLSSHEQIKGLYFGQVLELRDHSSRTDQDMTLDEGAIVNKSKDIFAHKENL